MNHNWSNTLQYYTGNEVIYNNRYFLFTSRELPSFNIDISFTDKIYILLDTLLFGLLGYKKRLSEEIRLISFCNQHRLLNYSQVGASPDIADGWIEII